METSMIMEAVRFMALGMSIVGMFLVIMILCIKLQAFIIGKYFSNTLSTSSPLMAQNSLDADDESSRIAAVMAALADYRKNIS